MTNQNPDDGINTILNEFINEGNNSGLVGNNNQLDNDDQEIESLLNLINTDDSSSDSLTNGSSSDSSLSNNNSSTTQSIVQPVLDETFINEENHYYMHTLNFNKERCEVFLKEYNKYYDKFKNKVTNQETKSKYIAFSFPNNKPRRFPENQLSKYVDLNVSVSSNESIYATAIDYYLNNMIYSMETQQLYNFISRGLVLAKITEYPNTIIETEVLDNMDDYEVIKTKNFYQESSIEGIMMNIQDTADVMFKKADKIIQISYSMLRLPYSFKDYTIGCHLGLDLKKFTNSNLLTNTELNRIGLSDKSDLRVYNKNLDSVIKTLYEFINFENSTIKFDTIEDLLQNISKANIYKEKSKKNRIPIYHKVDYGYGYGYSNYQPSQSNIRYSKYYLENYSITNLFLTDYSIKDIKISDVIPFNYTVTNKIKLTSSIFGHFSLALRESSLTINRVIRKNIICSFFNDIIKYHQIIGDNIKYVFSKAHHNNTVNLTILIKKDLLSKFIDTNIALSNELVKLFSIESFEKWNPDVYLNCISENNSYKFNNSTQIEGNDTSLENNINQLVNIPLFNYQKNNVKWMKQLENDILDGKQYPCFIDSLENVQNIKEISDKVVWSSDLINIPSHIIPYFTNHNNQKIMLRPVLKINQVKYRLEEYNNYITQNTKMININGGVLCDEVGLGKTLSMVTHLLTQSTIDKHNLSTGKINYTINNLIILPNRLINQWEFEINKYAKSTNNLSMIKIGSLTDIKKYEKVIKKDKDFISKLDIVLLSDGLLTASSYQKYLDDKKKSKIPSTNYLDIFTNKYNRIIIDEIHEKLYSFQPYGCTSNLLHDKSKHKKFDKKSNQVSSVIFDLECNFKWCLSATPFEYGPFNLMGLMQYLIGKEQRLKYQINKDDFDCVKGFNSLSVMSSIINNHFKGIKKSDVRTEIDIPIFTENIIRIPLSNIEKNIYNTFSGTNYYRDKNYYKKLFLICTNFCIADVLLKSEGDEVKEQKIMTLQELNQQMIKNFKDLKKKVEVDIVKYRNLLTNKKNIKVKYDFVKQTLSEISIFNKKEFDEYIQSLNLDYLIKDAIEYYTVKMEKKIIPYQYRYPSEKISTFTQIFDEISIKVHKLRNTSKTNLLNSSISDLLEKTIDIDDKGSQNYKYSIENCIKDIIKSDTIASLKFILDSYYKNDSIINNNVLLGLLNKVSIATSSILNTKIINYNNKLSNFDKEIKRYDNQIKLFESNEFIKEKTNDPCMICFDEFKRVVVTKCRHVFCGDCHDIMIKNKTVYPCPECRAPIKKDEVVITTIDNINNDDDKETETEEKPEVIIDKQNLTTTEILENSEWRNQCINKYGSKMTHMIEYLQTILQDADNRVIIFSQYYKMLKLIGQTLDEYKIKNIFCSKGHANEINKKIKMFKTDNSIRVIMLSSEKSGSGSNLTEANHIILVDVLNAEKSTTKDIESQAIGRAVRLGQNKPVTVTRLITTDTIEEEYYNKNKYDIAELQ